MSHPRLLFFSGSLRRDSWNHKLAAAACHRANGLGAETTIVRLSDFPMPLFNQDLEDESGIPDSAKALKSLFLSHDGLVIASPEYNSSFPAALKNCIDWVSRSESDEEAPLAAFQRKTALLLSASPGALGGIRGLVALRSLLGNLGIWVSPDQLAVPKAHEAFDADGNLASPEMRRRLDGMMQRYVDIASRLS